ncbi:hypothetical protein C8Q78DRAFT_469812 [Trametes maxima]|nr:hypothetical protein C8Q78DRAFT_469812 [Trametes maxima]
MVSGLRWLGCLLVLSSLSVFSLLVLVPSDYWYIASVVIMRTYRYTYGVPIRASVASVLLLRFSTPGRHLKLASLELRRSHQLAFKILSCAERLLRQHGL